MNILLATNRADLLGGAETAVRDLALGLTRRGHSAVVYSDGFYKGARPMEAESVTVVRDLAELAFRPDIIHGHFGLETMIALTRFPDAPAMFHIHGAGHFGAPPRHPRIHRYAAMMPSVGLRAVVESNIPESAMDILLNWVDLRRFAKVRAAGQRAARALFYNNYHDGGSRTVSEVRKAVGARGVQLDLIGRRLGKSIDDPENILPGYDLVFASGRSAIEALACGCAVIVISMTSCGELVTGGNFDRLRRSNFSAAVNSPPPVAERIEAQLDRYAAAGCAAVTEMLRREADLDRVITELEQIYAGVVAAHAAGRPDRRAEQLAVARYLRKMVPIVSMADELRTPGGIAPVRSESAVGAATARLNAL